MKSDWNCHHWNIWICWRRMHGMRWPLPHGNQSWKSVTFSDRHEYGQYATEFDFINFESSLIGQLICMPRKCTEWACNGRVSNNIATIRNECLAAPAPASFAYVDICALQTHTDHLHFANFIYFLQLPRRVHTWLASSGISHSSLANIFLFFLLQFCRTK